MSLSENIQQQLLRFLQSGQQIVVDAYRGARTQLEMAENRTESGVILTPLHGIYEFSTQGMVTDTFEEACVERFRVLKSVAERVQGIYSAKGLQHKTLTHLLESIETWLSFLTSWVETETNFLDKMSAMQISSGEKRDHDSHFAESVPKRRRDRYNTVAEKRKREPGERDARDARMEPDGIAFLLDKMRQLKER